MLPAGSPVKSVRNTVWKWIDFLYGPFFRVIGFFYRSYKSNRAAVARFMAKEKIAATMKFLAILFLFGWILVWMLASDESRNRLSEEFKRTVGGFGFNQEQPRDPGGGSDPGAD